MTFNFILTRSEEGMQSSCAQGPTFISFVSRAREQERVILTDVIYLVSGEWQEHDIRFDWIVGLTFPFQMTEYKYIHPKLPQLLLN